MTTPIPWDAIHEKIATFPIISDMISCDMQTSKMSYNTTTVNIIRYSIAAPFHANLKGLDHLKTQDHLPTCCVFYTKEFANRSRIKKQSTIVNY